MCESPVLVKATLLSVSDNADKFILIPCCNDLGLILQADKGVGYLCLVIFTRAKQALKT